MDTDTRRSIEETIDAQSIGRDEIIRETETVADVCGMYDNWATECGPMSFSSSDLEHWIDEQRETLGLSATTEDRNQATRSQLSGMTHTETLTLARALYTEIDGADNTDSYRLIDELYDWLYSGDRPYTRNDIAALAIEWAELQAQAVEA